MAFSLFAESAPSDFGVEDASSRPSETELRSASEQARELNGLLNELCHIRDALPEGSESKTYLDQVVAQVATCQTSLVAAVAARSSAASNIASAASKLIQDHYPNWMLYAKDVGYAGKWTPAAFSMELMHIENVQSDAVRIAETREFMDDISGSWYQGLDDYVKNELAREVDDMFQSDPDLEKGWDLTKKAKKNKVVNEIVKKHQAEDVDAWKDLRARFEDSDAVRTDLDRLGELAGKEEHISAKMSDIRDRLRDGTITAEQAAEEIRAETTHFENVTRGMYNRSFSDMDPAKREAIARSIGKDPSELTSEDVMKFMKDHEADLSSSERINEAFARERAGTATDEDKAIVAGAGLKARVEVLQESHNYVTHLQTLSPEEQKKVTQQLGEAVDKKDAQAFVDALAESGMDMSNMSREKQRALSMMIETMDKEDFSHMHELVKDSVKTGVDHSAEMEAIVGKSWVRMAQTTSPEMTQYLMGKEHAGDIEKAYLEYVHSPDPVDATQIADVSKINTDALAGFLSGGQATAPASTSIAENSAPAAETAAKAPAEGTEVAAAETETTAPAKADASEAAKSGSTYNFAKFDLASVVKRAEQWSTASWEGNDNNNVADSAVESNMMVASVDPEEIQAPDTPMVAQGTTPGKAAAGNSIV